MSCQIISKDRILAEFDRIKANVYEFSKSEICILVSANLCVPYESVQQVVEEREAA